MLTTNGDVSPTGATSEATPLTPIGSELLSTQGETQEQPFSTLLQQAVQDGGKIALANSQSRQIEQGDSIEQEHADNPSALLLLLLGEGLDETMSLNTATHPVQGTGDRVANNALGQSSGQRAITNGGTGAGTAMTGTAMTGTAMTGTTMSGIAMADITMPGSYLSGERVGGTMPLSTAIHPMQSAGGRVANNALGQNSAQQALADPVMAEFSRLSGIKPQSGRNSISMADGASPPSSYTNTVEIMGGNRVSQRTPEQLTTVLQDKIAGAASALQGERTVTLAGAPSAANIEGISGSVLNQSTLFNQGGGITSTVKLASTAATTLPQQLNTVLGERLQMQIDHKIQHAEIRLDPADMGKITIHLQMEAGKLQVNINASQLDVYRGLQQISQELRSQLTEQNINQVNLQITSQQPQHASQHFSQQQSQQEKNEQTRVQSEEIEQARQFTEAGSSSESDDSVLIKV